MFGSRSIVKDFSSVLSGTILKLIRNLLVRKYPCYAKVSQLSSIQKSILTSYTLTLRKVADLYNLSSYDMVTVNRISKDEELSVLHAVSADFVTVTIKEQYISRGDMHFFQNSLVGRWIYEGQRLSNKTKVSKWMKYNAAKRETQFLTFILQREFKRMHVKFGMEKEWPSQELSPPIL